MKSLMLKKILPAVTTAIVIAVGGGTIGTTLVSDTDRIDALEERIEELEQMHQDRQY